MNKDKSCFDCSHYSMCYLIKFHTANIIFDTYANDYKEKHYLFYETLAKCCQGYKNNEKK